MKPTSAQAAPNVTAPRAPRHVPAQERPAAGVAPPSAPPTAPRTAPRTPAASAAAAAKRATPRPTVGTHIDADAEFTGDFVTNGTVRIDGVIRGDVRAGSLTIGESARLFGAVVADRLLVEGQVEGEIQALKVTLAKTAKVVGDILHKELEVQNGAFIDGRCARIAPAAAEMVKAVRTVATKNAKPSDGKAKVSAAA